MNTITGKVLHTETGTGISDLIIAAYDLDPSAIDSSNSPGEISGQLYKWLLSTQLSGEKLKAYLELIYYGLRTDSELSRDTEEDPLLRTPMSIAGDRIGSVITNNRGEFSLTYDDAAFQINDQELRPDLVLYILAPEYSVEITPPDAGEFQVEPPVTEFVPVPEHLRVLHYSLFPRRNAGRLESFIVKLTSEQLERKKVAVPNPGGSDVDYAGLLEADQVKKEKIRDILRMHRQTKIAAHRKIEQEANNFVQNISAVPKALRESPLFVGQGTTVKQAEAYAHQRGIESIQGHQGKAFVRLSESDLRSLGIDDIQRFGDELNANGSTTRQVDLDNLCGLLQAKNGGIELTQRVPDLLRALRGQPSDTSDESDDSGSNPDDGDGNESSPSTLPIQDQIKQLVLEQVQAMKLSEPDEDCPETNQVQRIKETIRYLVPPASPADVTAFYDFHHLQVAFPNVWAEAFDGNVTELIRQMDIQYREYTDELEVARNPDGINPADLSDVNDYTRLMGKLVGDIASLENVPPMPPKVQELLRLALFASIHKESGAVRVNNGGAVRVAASGRSPSALGGSTTVRVRGGSSTIRVDNSTIDSMWQQLSIAQKTALINIANNQEMEEVDEPLFDIDKIIGGTETGFRSTISSLLTKDNADLVKAGIDLFREAKQTTKTRLEPIKEDEKQRRALDIISNPEGRVTRVQNLLKEMAERLQEPHSFRIFQKNTVNFGIVTTYRQKVKGDNYQATHLKGSMTLSPGESRKYTIRTMIRENHLQKENKKNASTVSDERTITSGAIADILEKAATTNNFGQTVQANMSGSVGVFSIGANTNTSFSRNQAVESQKTKSSRRESLTKSSQEFKYDHSVEFSTEQIKESESSFTSEISNPNNEITVTYLFYELERQYRITEHLHKLTPVVLVAQEIPNPADIDEDWLLAHEWILRRVLLDNSFNEALDYIADGLISDEVSIEIKREHYETQKALVEDLSTTLGTLTSLQDTLRETLVQTSEQEQLARVARKRAKNARRRLIRRVIFGVPQRLASGSSSLAFGNRGEDPAVLEARREALESRLGFLEGSLEDTRSQLTAANNALEQATAELTVSIEESFTKRNLVTQFRLHVKDNILHYMHAIWSREHPHQRDLRVGDIPVRIPVPSGSLSASGTRSVEVRFEQNRSPVISGLHTPLLRNTALRNSDRLNDIFASIRLPAPSAVEFEVKRLQEIAYPAIGYYGNFMICPLKQCTYITDFMMQDYIDDYFGIRDPDPVGDFTTEELLRYAEALYHDESIPESEREETRIAINQLVQDRLTSPRVENELISVPTGQLFIEALKGEHALLENFKELHRQLDVEKVHEEVRGAKLENLRKAMRLAQDVPVLDDFDVDRKIVIEGNGANVIVPSEG